MSPKRSSGAQTNVGLTAVGRGVQRGHLPHPLHKFAPLKTRSCRQPWSGWWPGWPTWTCRTGCPALELEHTLLDVNQSRFICAATHFCESNQPCTAAAHKAVLSTYTGALICAHLVGQVSSFRRLRTRIVFLSEPVVTKALPLCVAIAQAVKFSTPHSC